MNSIEGFQLSDADLAEREVHAARLSSFKTMVDFDGTMPSDETVHLAILFLADLYRAIGADAVRASKMITSPGNDGSVNFEFGEYERAVLLNAPSVEKVNLLVCREFLTREGEAGWAEAIDEVRRVATGEWPKGWPAP